MVYLDHNATSCLRPQALLAMESALSLQANPSSVHRWGRAAKSIVEKARRNVASFVHAKPEEVIFTAGGTEANFLALWGGILGAAESGEPITRLLVSALEHDSMLGNAKTIAERTSHICLEIIPASSDGIVNVDALRDLLAEGGRTFVAVMAANNETGVIQPLAEIIEITHSSGGLFAVDAVQSCGKVSTDFEDLGADYLTLSAHKLGGPQGVGALIARDSAPFARVISGGGQENNRRAGTENVAGIAGFGAAARACADDDIGHLRHLRDRFELGLKQRFNDAVIFGEPAPRLSNTSNFALPGIDAETALIALDLDGVMISSGAACSSGKVRPSHVLEAMGVSGELARSALRVSLGWNSNESDIDAALASLAKLSVRVAARQAA
ncbi:MAG TPA: cysteine desulfurase family protein [Rhizomicrobium sp.]|jgi:cysteine desulfurase